ncbi:hypothetical protein H0H93_009072, partial [Arthromyces matolae]
VQDWSPFHHRIDYHLFKYSVPLPPTLQETLQARYLGHTIRVTVVGPNDKPSTAVLRSHETIGALLDTVIHVHLRQISPLVYFPPYQSRPLEHDNTLSDVGIVEGSTVYIRWRLRGGSTTPHSHDEQQLRSSTEFQRQTGMFNIDNPHLYAQQSPGLWRCTVCSLAGVIPSRRLKQHAGTKGHQQAVKRHLRSERPPSRATPEAVRTPLLDMFEEILKDPEMGLKEWALEPALNDPYSGLDWDDLQEVRAEAMPTGVGLLMAQMADKARQYLLDPEALGQDSESEVDERSEAEDSSDSSGLEELYSASQQRNNPGRGRHRITDDTNSPFFPWPDRETCILDIIRHIPRCAFSRRQNETIHWAVLALGIRNDFPSDRVMRGVDTALQDLCGIGSRRYKGAFGHVYYVNDIAAIISQEMANPQIRQHLHFYPEDAGDELSEAWQAQRWKAEIGSQFLTPMVRVHQQDFYTDEICLLHDTSACMPTRWFIRGGVLYGIAWRAQVYGQGWIIDMRSSIEIEAKSLLLATKGLVSSHRQHAVPDPRTILFKMRPE